MKKSAIYLPAALGLSLLLASCSLQKKIGEEARQDILSGSDFAQAHVGISIYDPSTQKYLYNYQADKLFVPASNTKLLTCYVAMRTLGDSLVALRYIDKGDGTIVIEGNGDASFLHPDFKDQPALQFLQKQKRIQLTDANWKDNAFGMGWAWDDYGSDYMAERSPMPVYGNVVRFRQTDKFSAVPSRDQHTLEQGAAAANGLFTINRDYRTGIFSIVPSTKRFSAVDIPFVTGGARAAAVVIGDTLKTTVVPIHDRMIRAGAMKVYSQPTDSLLKIMMHRSDNFFAEQTLLMVSNERLEIMSDSKIIDTLLKTDLASLPQKPKWVDGSGLSRYNLVTPQDFVWILTQMKNEFKWERIKTILPTGNEGTLSGLYKNYAGNIYAKTGTLSNHVALSGYLITKKGKQLIFSIMVNAHLTSAPNIRKGIEKFLTAIIDRY